MTTSRLFAMVVHLGFRCEGVSIQFFSKETIMTFFKRLRVVLSFPDRHKSVTKKWTWIELCQNAVLNKIIDIIMTTINKSFATSWPVIELATSRTLGRRGSRINTDWFPKRAPKAQASRGSSGRLPQGSFWIFNSFKSSFLHRFPSHLDGILARVHFGKCFI